ncbi:MAG: hypothetical protein HGA37_14355, partial [Lentimicrobium sp.]|nr:hypothetical protein [Lentimicrobium sp.]
MANKIKQTNIYRTNLAVADPDEDDILEEVLMNSVITDEAGNETERISYNSDGSPDERVIIRYINNKPVEEVLEMSGEHGERTTREFDENGRLVKEFRHYLDGEPDEIIYEYDAENRLVKRQLTDSDGEEGEKHLWIYENKLLIREESYNEYGDLESSKTYTYYDNGVPEEVVELNVNGGEQTRLVSLFNEEGKPEAEKRYDSRGRLTARNIYTYDDKGFATAVEEETVTGKTTVNLQYDEAGNNILHEETDSEGTVVSRIERTFNSDNQP